MTAQIISLADRRKQAKVGRHAPLNEGITKRAEIERLLHRIAINLGIDGHDPFAYPPKPPGKPK